jgi:[ribosomal protein S5]-alanine N-acetyltransferase
VTTLPPWPTRPPTHGSIVLRPFTDDDVDFAIELGEDPYVPLIGTLPAHPTRQQASAWIDRQHGRYADGAGLPFVIADAESGRAVGMVGLWLRNLPEGRGSVGYSVAPAHRGRGVAGSGLRAITAFAWTIPSLHRIEAYIEPWNTGSVRVAESAGYQREGLLRRYREIGGSRRDVLLYATVR